MELYPLKFKPILKDKIWGGTKLNQIYHKQSTSSKIGESWELSGMEGDVSEVENGFLEGNTLNELVEIYMGDLVGEAIYEKFGLEFPLLFKLIDANDVLSIQVHPDDTLARKRHNALGKTEMWYVLESDKDSEIITGFNRKVDKSMYLEKLKSGELVSILNKEKTTKGDAFMIPAGRIHAIGKGILLAEIQQTSDITYRIYDWDRTDDSGNPRELHTDWAIDAIDYQFYDSYRIDYEKKINDSSNLVDGQYFTTNLIHIDQTIETDYSILDSFVVYMCVEGQVKIELNNGSSELLKVGETILIPAIAERVKIITDASAKLIEVYIKPDQLK